MSVDEEVAYFNRFCVEGPNQDQMLVAVQGNASDQLYLLLVELWVPNGE